LAARFDFATAIELEGHNDEIDEARITALGKIGKKLRVLVYTWRARNVRVIGLRGATAQEKRLYIDAKNYRSGQPAVDERTAAANAADEREEQGALARRNIEDARLFARHRADARNGE
jgi:uncharacterized DUF497 family protein